MGTAKAEIRKNEVTLLAILLDLGPIKNKRGLATRDLFNLFQMNGGTVKTCSGMSLIMERAFSGYVQKQSKGKRTYSIELTGVPVEYEDEVLGRVPELVYEVPVQQVESPVPAWGMVPPLPTIQVASMPAEQPTAGEIADALLAKVIAVIDEPKIQGADPQKLREAWDQLEALRRGYGNLQEDFNRQGQRLQKSETEVARLRGEIKQLNENIRIMRRDNNGVVDSEVRRVIDGVMRAIPTTKG